MAKGKAFLFLLMESAKSILSTLITLLVITGCATVGQNISDSVHELPPKSGTILINITNLKQFVEFELSNGSLMRTTEGKSQTFGRNVKSESDDFRRTYDRLRLYGREEKEEKLRSILSQYDLYGLYWLHVRFLRNKGNLGNDKYFLPGPSRMDGYVQSLGYSYFFIPNMQFSYVIYDRSFLINLGTKEITFPFGMGLKGKVEWSPDGRYVAYSADPTMKDKICSLEIKDILENRTILKRDLDRLIGDITWSPDSKHVALLTFTSKMHASFFAVAGHPEFYHNFYLEICDIAGKELYRDRVIEDNVRNKFGRLVWMTDAIEQQ